MQCHLALFASEALVTDAADAVHTGAVFAREVRAFVFHFAEFSGEAFSTFAAILQLGFRVDGHGHFLARAAIFTAFVLARKRFLVLALIAVVHFIAFTARVCAGVLRLAARAIRTTVSLVAGTRMLGDVASVTGKPGARAVTTLGRAGACIEAVARDILAQSVLSSLSGAVLPLKSFEAYAASDGVTFSVALAIADELFFLEFSGGGGPAGSKTRFAVIATQTLHAVATRGGVAGSYSIASGLVV